MQTFDWIVDIIFIVDIIVNFRTTYINVKTDTEVTEPSKIAINYVFYGRFFIDLLAVLPFELMVPEDENGNTAS